MRILLSLCVLALVLVCGSNLAAQKGVPAGGNPGKAKNKYKQSGDQQAKEAQKRAQEAARKAEQEEKEAEREAEKAEREERRAGKDAEDTAEKAPEAGASEKIPQPGETVKRADKDAQIDKWMDELKLTDATLRAKFKTLARGAWEDCEKEDKRYYAALKKTDDAEGLKKLGTEHRDNLAKTWTEADTGATKDSLLDATQLESWKKLSDSLRTGTNTDRWLAAQSKPAETEKPEKKEKKEESED
ncbi:MAG: hypothetical protein IT464_12300 [Planctomycetes bacterium]|nr:hypothetical protein [Planctomycetota bacterium]